MSALISSLSEDLLAHVFGLKTLREVWVTLEKMFASQSKARVLQNHLQLTSLKKGTLSIADYFQKAQTLAQTLAAIGEPIKDSKLLSYILGGLGVVYESLVTSISTRIEPVLLDDLYSHLLMHEQRLENVHNPIDFSVSTVNENRGKLLIQVYPYFLTPCSF